MAGFADEREEPLGVFKKGRYMCIQGLIIGDTLFSLLLTHNSLSSKAISFYTMRDR